MTWETRSCKPTGENQVYKLEEELKTTHARHISVANRVRCTRGFRIFLLLKTALSLTLSRSLLAFLLPVTSSFYPSSSPVPVL